MANGTDYYDYYDDYSYSSDPYGYGGYDPYYPYAGGDPYTTDPYTGDQYDYGFGGISPYGEEDPSLMFAGTGASGGGGTMDPGFFSRLLAQLSKNPMLAIMAGAGLLPMLGGLGTYLGGGGGGGQTQRSISTNVLSPEQQALYNLVFGGMQQAQNYAYGPGGVQSQLQAQAPMQNQWLSQAGNIAGGVNRNANQLLDLYMGRY